MLNFAGSACALVLAWQRRPQASSSTRTKGFSWQTVQSPPKNWCEASSAPGDQLSWLGITGILRSTELQPGEKWVIIGSRKNNSAVSVNTSQAGRRLLSQVWVRCVGSAFAALSAFSSVLSSVE